MGVIFKNSVMYNSSNILNYPVCYSEEEREIGCWTDGKPLYQKTIIINSIISGNNTINHEIDNVDKIVHCIGIFFSNAGNSVSIPNGNLSSTWSISMYDFGVTNFKLSVGSDWIQYFDHICVTIQYTKTTDQPGSGTWTPQGVPAVHYDGDEKVVGTWFGETLYEKSGVHVGNVSSAINTYEIIDLTDCNVDKIVEMHKCGDNGSYSYSTTNGLYINYNRSTKKVYIQTAQYTAEDTFYATVRYTKSTS